ncbi:MAG: amidohydrolase [Myxococcales bacterium]|nr:amidohydrolase [Myxococcota bacterium]MDW8282835.1 amidohydrolase [Myxococcales bacterium]
MKRAAVLLLALAAPARADLLLVGVQVLTMDPGQPTAEALAIRGQRIAYVGDEAGARAAAGPQTRVIDGRGELTVLPGLIDAHAHLVGLGLSLRQLDLRGLSSPAAVAERVKEAARRAGPQGWIVGRGWDQNRFPGQSLPTHQVLDQAAPGRPVWLRRIDGHAGWANREALRRAGIDRTTPDPPGGRIVRDAQGEPTGVLIDNAMDLIARVVPAPSAAELEEAILAGSAHVIRRGLVAVHEMGLSPEAVAAYRRLATQGRLPLRVYGYAQDPMPAPQVPTSPQYRAQLEALARRFGPPEHGAFFSLVGFKLFMDGALGSRGAALLEDYSDEPGHRGLLVSPPEHIEAMARWALQHRYQIATHAIGDRAVRLVLDAYERAGVGRAPWSRFRIEHAQVVAPQDRERFARLGVIASVQPTHATSDMPWAGARLGPERLRHAYAWQALLQAGAQLCGGSDFPVEEADPLHGLHAALWRQSLQGQPPGGFQPDQRLSLGEALRLFTTDAAYAAFAEQRAGQIRPGRPADLTVVQGRLSLSGPAPEDLGRRAVRLTIIDGQIVYDGLQGAN